MSYCYAATPNVGGGNYQRRTPTAQTRFTVRIPARTDRFESKSVNLFDAICDELRNAQTSLRGGLAGKKQFELRHGVDAQITGPYGTPAIGAAAAATSAGVAAVAIKPHWQANHDLCVELLGDDSYEICADQHLRIAPGTTLEFRAASAVWPLLRILSTDGQQCGNPWIVELGPGSKLILNGLQVCGATLRTQDIPSHLGNKSLDSTGKPNQSTACNCNLPAAGGKPAISTDAPVQAAATVSCGIRHSYPMAGWPKFRPLSAQDASISMHITEGRADRGPFDCGHARHSKSPLQRRQDAARRTRCPYFPVSVQVSDSIIDSAIGRMAITSECCGPCMQTSASSGARYWEMYVCSRCRVRRTACSPA